MYHSAEHFLADMPIAKAIGGVISNQTPQEVGAQISNLGSSASDTLQDATKDPMNAVLNFAPMGMGTIIGKSAKGWATAEGKFSNMLDRQPRAEISDVGFRIKAEYDPKYKFYDGVKKLGDLVEGPILEQYPWLKDIEISQKAGWASQAGEMGSYAPGKGKVPQRITLNAGNPHPEQTLIHEIQHAIQRKEGFARGGSPASFTTVDSLLNLPVVKKQTDALFKKYSKNGKLYSKEYNVAMEKILEDNGLKDVTPIDVYRRLGGEIESRSVAARSNIPQDQLKYSQPYGSENIPLKEWISAEDYLDK